MFGKELSCEMRQESTFGDSGIAPIEEFVKLNELSVANPDFKDAQRSINCELPSSACGDIDLKDNVRWRIRIQIDGLFSENSRKIGHIVAGVRLSPFC